ncbi:hypothetical protein CCACVL1_23132 [Corchorus capsularis]|uniref:Uncharacterized protein n=1 Tax=Corchorus capsularis TaxID=210143 RepID=A0A1R3GVB1_COCAP|nr:hypothetical protein CCACVL1_23132 [Corchorus capsularis]
MELHRKILIDGGGVNAIDIERKPLPTLVYLEETSTPPYFQSRSHDVSHMFYYVQAN